MVAYKKQTQNPLKKAIDFAFAKLFKGFESIAVVLIIIFVITLSMLIVLNPALIQLGLWDETFRVATGSVILLLLLTIFYRLILPLFKKP